MGYAAAPRVAFIVYGIQTFFTAIIIIIKNFIKKSVSQYRNNNNNKITSAGAKVLNLHNSHNNNLTQCDYLSIKTNQIIEKKKTKLS